jgi:hypothetical protein
VLYRARTYPGSRSSGRQIWTPGQELHLRCLLLCRQSPSLLGHRARRTVCLYTAYGANYGIAIWGERLDLHQLNQHGHSVRPICFGFAHIWCSEQDSNLHDRSHCSLNAARLPLRHRSKLAKVRGLGPRRHGLKGHLREPLCIHLQIKSTPRAATTVDSVPYAAGVALHSPQKIARDDPGGFGRRGGARTR